MWVIMIISYIVVSYIDTKSFARLKEKGILPLYIILMVISWAIGISNAYINDFPSPAVPIRDLILSIIGS